MVALSIQIGSFLATLISAYAFGFGCLPFSPSCIIIIDGLHYSSSSNRNLWGSDASFWDIVPPHGCSPVLGITCLMFVASCFGVTPPNHFPIPPCKSHFRLLRFFYSPYELFFFLVWVSIEQACAKFIFSRIFSQRMPPVCSHSKKISIFFTKCTIECDGPPPRIVVRLPSNTNWSRVGNETLFNFCLERRPSDEESPLDSLTLAAVLQQRDSSIRTYR